MSFPAATLIAGRYELLDLLGSGAMGAVWKARDTKFSSRFVAIKLLRDDESLREDARNRERFIQALRQEVRHQGTIAVTFLANSLDEALQAKAGSCREQVDRRFGAGSPNVAEALDLFDQLVNDPTYSENARRRAKQRRLFRDEANSVANLRHDNIVSISDTGEHEGVPFLAMDYIEGQTLARVIQRQEPIKRIRQLQLMEDLCEGLHHAHTKNLVHRDIKPANLIIDASNGRLKILDFGVVRNLTERSDSSVGMLIGTFNYMSPEQTLGSGTLDHRSDIFAVGAVCYELLSYRKAFPSGGGTIDLLTRIQHEPPAPLRRYCADLQPGLEKIIDRALQKDPADRYQSLAHMRREIVRLRQELQREEVEEEHTLLSTIVQRVDTNAVAPEPSAPPAPAAPPGPTPQEVLAAEVEAALTRGDDDAALHACERQLDLTPNDAQVWALRDRVLQVRLHRQLARWLETARQQLAAGQLTAAGETLAQAHQADPGAEGLLALQQQLRAARHERSQERAAAEARRVAEEQRLAEAKRLADQQRIAEQRRRAEEQRLADERRRAEEERLAEARRLAEEQRLAEAKRLAEQQRLAEEQRLAAEQRRRVEEEARLAAERRAKEEEEARVRAEARRGEEERRRHVQVPAVLVDQREAATARRVVGRGRIGRGRMLAGVGLAVGVLVLSIGSYTVLRRTADGANTATSTSARTGSGAGAGPGTGIVTMQLTSTTTTVPPTSGDPHPAPASAQAMLSVDAQPWARVRIIPLSGQPPLSVGALVTPFTIAVPPGDYRLELENDQLRAPATSQRIHLDPNKPATVRLTMPGFDGDRIVGQLLGPPE